MLKLDRRRISPRHGWLVALLFVLAVAPVSGSGSTDAAGSDPAEPAEAAVQLDHLPASASAPTEASVGAAAGNTWQLQSHEYCPDRFATTCPNGATSADPCPVSNPQGKPCSPAGDYCWHVISAYWADEYRCTFTP